MYVYVCNSGTRNIIYIDKNAEETECPETLARNYQSALRNSPEELRTHVPHGGSLKSRDPLIIFRNITTVFFLWLTARCGSPAQMEWTVASP
jgi:hypothetical protein